MALLDRILDETALAFGKRDIDAAYRIQPLRKLTADMISELKESHLARMGTGECNVFHDPNYENLLSDMMRIADVSSNVGEAVIVRVRPEIASQEHSYFADLRHEDANYDRVYKEAHDYFHSMLPEGAYGKSGGSLMQSMMSDLDDA